jgi:hypothetical protein
MGRGGVERGMIRDVTAGDISESGLEKYEPHVSQVGSVYIPECLTVLEIIVNRLTHMNLSL